MKTLLLTTAGGVVAAHLVEIMAPWRDRIRIVGLNSDPAVEPIFRCDTVYLVPPVSEREAWRRRVGEILREERPGLVVPTRDGDLEPFAEFVVDPAFAETLFFAPGPQSAAILVDKLASYRFSQAHGLPFVETAAEMPSIERLVARVGFPILAKPRIGSGAEDVRIVRSWDQVRALLLRSEPVFQEYLGDRAVLDLPVLDAGCGMPLIYSFAGRALLSGVGVVMPDRRVLSCGTIGNYYRGMLPWTVVRNEDSRCEAMLLDLGAALAATDFTGFFNVQAVPLADGPSLPFEYNGRVPGVSRPRSLLGMPQAPLLAHLLLGGSLPPLLDPAPAGRICTLLRSDFCAASDVRTLSQEGRWTRSPATLSTPPPVVRSERPTGAVKTLMLSTSGGVVAALHCAVLAPWRDRIRVVGLNSEAAAEPNFRCDATYLVPPTEDRRAWLQRVAGILHRERPDMVVPTRDGDLEPLAEIAGDEAFAGTLFFTPGKRTAGMMVDKLAQYRFAQRHGLAFVETAAELGEIEHLVARTGFPILSKPRVGTGSQGVRLVRSWAEVHRLRQRTDPVFQDYVGDRSVLRLAILDPALGVPLFHGIHDRRHVSAVGAVLPDRRVHFCGAIGIAYQAPDISRVERADDPRLARMSQELGEALAAEDFVGLFNLQAVEAEDGALVPIEYNGRLVGAARSRLLLEVSESPVILHLLLREPLPMMPGPPPDGFVATAPQAEYYADADVATLNRERVWQRPNAGCR